MDIKDIVKFHRKKFLKADKELQERKIWEEMAEFQTAISEREKVEEAVDCIIACIGFIDKMGYDTEKEIEKKIEIIKKRPYDENDFKHINKFDTLEIVSD